MKVIKLRNKVCLLMAAFGVLVSCIVFFSTEVQAAPKTSTDITKKGVIYPSKVRTGIRKMYDSMYIRMPDKSGYYIASVKTSSQNLIAKATSRTNSESKYYSSSSATISYFAKREGTYTITFVVRNAKNKKVGSFKTKVYANEYDVPFRSISYAGKQINVMEFNNYLNAKGTYGQLTTKGSGKIKVKLNPGYSLKSVKAGTYDSAGNIKYKTVKNNTNITLAKTTVYNKKGYSADSGSYYNYICPVTFIKFTYKDKKLGIVREAEMHIFKKK